MTTYPNRCVAFTKPQRTIYIIGGDRAIRLQAYWHMAPSDDDFWWMLENTK